MGFGGVEDEQALVDLGPPPLYPEALTEEAAQLFSQAGSRQGIAVGRRRDEGASEAAVRRLSSRRGLWRRTATGCGEDQRVAEAGREGGAHPVAIAAQAALWAATNDGTVQRVVAKGRREDVDGGGALTPLQWLHGHEELSS